MHLLPARQGSQRVSKDMEVQRLDDSREVLLRSWLLYGRRDPTAFPGACNVPLDPADMDRVVCRCLLGSIPCIGPC